MGTRKSHAFEYHLPPSSQSGVYPVLRQTHISRSITFLTMLMLSLWVLACYPQHPTATAFCSFLCKSSAMSPLSWCALEMCWRPEDGTLEPPPKKHQRTPTDCAASSHHFWDANLRGGVLFGGMQPTHLHIQVQPQNRLEKGSNHVGRHLIMLSLL